MKGRKTIKIEFILFYFDEVKKSKLLGSFMKIVFKYMRLEKKDLLQLCVEQSQKLT